MSNPLADKDRDLSVDELAEIIGMSPRWVRQKIAEGAEHQRYGHKIRFTPAQVAAFRASFTSSPAPAAVTTGRRRRAS